MHIRKDDLVEVITGDDRGDPQGRVIRKVLRVLPDEDKVVVENVNRVYKHLKPSRRNPQGGRLSKEMPLHVSNVMLYCPTCRRGVRVGHRYDQTDGHKERYCKKCKNTLRAVSKARKAYAQKA
jgi:large subunit ribosomal protein L24